MSSRTRLRAARARPRAVAAAINSAPGKTTLWTFRCIDSKWVQVAYAAL